jgi:hypothetical protein
MSDTRHWVRCTCGKCEPVVVMAPADARLYPTYTVRDGVAHVSGLTPERPEAGPLVPLAALNLDAVRWGDVASGRIDEEGGRR